MSCTIDLSRFVEAHRRDFALALSEIQSGRKRSHWMWFIFPQLAGLGRSYYAEYFAIPDLDCARAFLDDPYLGENLRTISRALLELPGSSPTSVLGSPDDLKLRSCMTLFEAADPREPVFSEVLEKYCQGQRDPYTLSILSNHRAL